jgi:hypothetical protein
VGIVAHRALHCAGYGSVLRYVHGGGHDAGVQDLCDVFVRGEEGHARVSYVSMMFLRSACACALCLLWLYSY